MKKKISRLLLLVAVLLILLGSQFYPVRAGRNPVRIPPNMEWVSTGIWVEAGQAISLSGQGLVIRGPIDISFGAGRRSDGQIWDLGCSPDQETPSPCVLIAAPYGALVGRVGTDGIPFLISGTSQFTSPTSGNLYLVLNDKIGFYNDELNGFTVLLRE